MSLLHTISSSVGCEFLSLADVPFGGNRIGGSYSSEVCGGAERSSTTCRMMMRKVGTTTILRTSCSAPPSVTPSSCPRTAVLVCAHAHSRVKLTQECMLLTCLVLAFSECHHGASLSE